MALHCRAHSAYEAKLVFGRYLPPEVREARIEYEAAWAAVPERRKAVREIQAGAAVPAAASAR